MKETVIDESLDQFNSAASTVRIVLNEMLKLNQPPEVREYGERLLKHFNRAVKTWREALYRSTKKASFSTEFRKRREKKGNTPLNPLKEIRDQEKIYLSSRTRDGEIEFLFDEWWDFYPRKVGKQAAWKRYLTLAKLERDPKAWAARQGGIRPCCRSALLLCVG